MVLKPVYVENSQLVTLSYHQYLYICNVAIVDDQALQLCIFLCGS